MNKYPVVVLFIQSFFGIILLNAVWTAFEPTKSLTVELFQRNVVGDSVETLTSQVNSMVKMFAGIPGLDGWTGIASGIRKGLSSNPKGFVAIFGVPGSAFDANAAAQYFIGVIIFLGAILLLSIVTFVLAILALSCCSCMILGRKRTPYTNVNKIVAGVLYALAITATVVGMVTGFKGNGAFSESLVDLLTNIETMIANLSDIAPSLAPAINSTFDVVYAGNEKFRSSLSNTIVGNFENDDSLQFTTKNLTRGLQMLDANFKNVNQIGDDASAMIVQLSDDTSVFKDEIDALNEKLLLLNDVLTYSTIGTYFLNTDISPLNEVALENEAAGLIADPSDALDAVLLQLRVPAIPNLGVVRSDIIRKMAGLGTEVDYELLDPSGEYQRATTGIIDSSLNTAQNLVSDISIAFDDFVLFLKAPTDALFEAAVQFDAYRFTAMLVLFVTPVTGSLVMTFFLMCRCPSRMKKSATGYLFLWCVFYLLAILFFIFALIIGETCKDLTDNNAAGLQSVLGFLKVSNINITEFIDAKKRCDNGESFITVASSLEMFGGGFDSINIKDQINSVVNEEVLTENIMAIDNSDFFPKDQTQEISAVFTPQRKSQTMTAMNAVEGSSLYDAEGSPLILEDTITTDLPDLKTALQVLYASVTDSDFTFSGAGFDATEKDNAVDAYKVMLQECIGLIDSVILDTDSLYVQLETQRSDVKDSLGIVESAMDSAFTYSLVAAGFAVEANSAFAIASEDSNSKAAAGASDLTVILTDSGDAAYNKLLELTPCETLANDFNAMQDTLCLNFQESIDSLWLTCLFFGLLGLFSLPVVVFTANSLADRHASRPDRHAEYADYNETNVEDQAEKGIHKAKSVSEKESTANNHKSTPKRVLGSELDEVVVEMPEWSDEVSESSSYEAISVPVALPIVEKDADQISDSSSINRNAQLEMATAKQMDEFEFIPQNAVDPVLVVEDVSVGEGEETVNIKETARDEEGLEEQAAKEDVFNDQKQEQTELDASRDSNVSEKEESISESGHESDEMSSSDEASQDEGEISVETNENMKEISAETNENTKEISVKTNENTEEISRNQGESREESHDNKEEISEEKKSREETKENSGDKVNEQSSQNDEGRKEDEVNQNEEYIQSDQNVHE